MSNYWKWYVTAVKERHPKFGIGNGGKEWAVGEGNSLITPSSSLSLVLPLPFLHSPSSSDLILPTTLSRTSTQMAEIETLGILQDIESLVADQLQVVITSFTKFYFPHSPLLRIIFQSKWSQSLTLILWITAVETFF